MSTAIYTQATLRAMHDRAERYRAEARAARTEAQQLLEAGLIVQADEANAVARMFEGWAEDLFAQIEDAWDDLRAVA